MSFNVGNEDRCLTDEMEIPVLESETTQQQ